MTDLRFRGITPDGGGSCRFDKPLIHGSGVTCEITGTGEQTHGDLRTLSFQETGDDETVSTVVAFAAKNGDDFPGGRAACAFECLDYPRSGSFHQGSAGYARFLNRVTIKLLHLSGCDDFHEISLCVKLRRLIAFSEQIPCQWALLEFRV